MSGHNCQCGNTLYRRMQRGEPVFRKDAYVWCRNEKCKKYNVAQGKSRWGAILPAIEPINKPVEPPKPAPEPEKVQTVPELPVVPGEPKFVAEIRNLVRQSIAKLEESYSRPVIGLAFAIAAQETQSFAVANKLISEYGLEKLYGIKKRNL